MIQTIARNWWLLALCGVFEAIYAIDNLVMQNPDGSPALRTHVTLSTILWLGRLALAAGVCVMIAGMWRCKIGTGWPLVLHGVALSALGLILSGILGSRISFRSIALSIVAIALSLGILEFETARTLGWAGAVSIGFAAAFFALAFHWIKLEPRPGADFIWYGAYFGFSAICMLLLALRMHTPSLSLK